MMKLTKKTEIWVNVLISFIFIILSVTVFYISFIVEKKSLSLSLFGLFFVLFMGLLVIILDYRIESKNYGLWVRTVTSLVFTNVIFFVILILIFSGSVSNYLAFSISYTLAQCLITFIKYKLDSKYNTT
jgi:hypothetical protein